MAEIGEQPIVLLGNADHRRQQTVFIDAAFFEQDLSPVLDREQGKQHVRGGELLADALGDVACLCENLSKIGTVDHFGSRLENASKIVYTQKTDRAKYRLQAATSARLRGVWRPAGEIQPKVKLLRGNHFRVRP
jgi:hypothetical protein